MQRRYVAQADPKRQRVDFYVPPVGQPFHAVPRFHAAVLLFHDKGRLFLDEVGDFLQLVLFFFPKNTFFLLKYASRQGKRVRVFFRK